jgi:hypothetical protein
MTAKSKGTKTTIEKRAYLKCKTPAQKCLFFFRQQ